jgi:hypothetical protein
VQKFLKKYVKQVTFFADAGFRGCDWAQLCLKLGWNYSLPDKNRIEVEEMVADIW